MSDQDPRKVYIISQVKNIFQLKEVPRDLLTNTLIEDFLDTINVNAIRISKDPNSNSLLVERIDSNGSSSKLGPDSVQVCISKVRNEEITHQQMYSQIIINTINSSPLLTLLNNLQNVYLPTLQSKQWADQIDNNIKRLLDELKVGLDNTLSKGSKSSGSFDEDNFAGIMTPCDEFEFWADALNSGIPNLQERARFYNDRFSQIYKYYKDLKSVDISGLREVIDQTWEVLDAVWSFTQGKEAYREARMKNLFELISNAIGGRIQEEIPEDQLWDPAASNIKPKLYESLRACKGWSEGISQYTQGIWLSKTATHRWKDEKYTSQFMNNLIQRLNHLLELRTQLDELIRINTMQKSLKIPIKDIFTPLTQVNAFHVSIYSQQAWDQSVSLFSKNLEAVEKDIANYLRQEVFTELTNPTQAVKEAQRWSGLLSRATMMKVLQTERDQLLAGLFTHVDKLKEDFESRSGVIIETADGIPSGHNFSPAVNSINWVRQLSAKVRKALTNAQSFLSDLRKFANFQQTCNDLMNAMKEYENEQFESWKDGIMDILNKSNNAISLQMSGKLMELDMADGLLKVNYSERLVLLLRETRQLCEMGFRKQIPPVIHKTVEDGKRFYKEALTLKQVANFYNSMSSQIIESQKSMVVDLAIRFEKVVKSTPSKGEKNRDGVNEITWDNPIELETYIAKVQEAAQNIMNENRKLRKIHMTICDQVNELFNIDLLKHRNIWKDHIDNIKKTIDSVTSNRDPKLCKPWRVHWDYQVYKVLEYQYQKGLENLNQNLPEIKVELVYSNKNIGYKPAIEELKQRYYKEVKAFITLPSTNFTGFGGNSDIFKQIPEKNSHYLSIVYSKTEELFSKLIKFTEGFKQWAVIGAIDMEAIIEKHFKNNEDWDQNLKALRLKRRDLEKIPESYKIDCFTVSLSPFKNSIEDLIQRHIEAITNSLRNSIKVDCDQIDEFINFAYEKLTKKPNSIEEITQAKAEIYEINQKRLALAEKFKRVEDKNKLLRNMVGNAYNISTISKRWENFDVSLEGFNKMLGEQQDVIKSDIEKKTNQLNSDIEKFYHRWTALKPKKLEQLDRESAKEIASKMKEWRNDWNELENRITSVTNDSKYFDLPPPQFTYLKEVRGDLVDQEGSWAYFDEFETELAVMEKEDWLSFRAKVFNFQDFTFKWGDRVKSVNKDACGLYLMSQVELYKQIWPVLKMVIGEAFEKEHWRTLFAMLKLAKEVTIENLTFGHILSAEKLLLQKEQEIKELAARAQGEVTLREAINELRVWCDTTDFVLTEHNSNGRTTPLIKEWKELMTKVSDNQALLGTLKESKFYDRFRDQIEQFEQKLGGIDDYLQKLNIIQRKWVYLEPIFGRGALPQEQPRFKRLDDEFRGIMLGIQRDPKVVGLCAIPGIKDTLDMILDQLERCQKALNNFLEEKRTKFPRFYFLGDDDLLEILGQAKNPNVIQIHLKKLFAGIHKVQFSDNLEEITAMRSSANEVVPLKESIHVNEEIETWLGHLSKNMQATLQGMLISCLKEQTLEFNKYPSQILNLSEEISFHNNTLNAINSGKLAALKSELQGTLEKYTGNTNVTNVLLQLKLKALILDLIHQIEVVDTLIANNVNDPNSWHWYRQLKFSLNPKTRLCLISMCRAEFDYTYEYQGNAAKLVHTPLTDKCYLTLTQGMSMGLGGNPYGPAGTGKTESVKALGQAFGRQVLVFNCDEGIDFKSMGRIFIGLVKCGAWGCFDEFNRLLEEQLSAISQQIQIIQFAIKEKQPALELLGKNIEVNQNAGIFVTMNPAGKNYGGRSKLPDNLKQLFRPVAMSVPDNELIAEVLLFAEGFKTAKVLAKKIVSIFNLSKQLLSFQQHYDWGLRALKTILTVGGQLIQEERKRGIKLDPTTEAILLIKAIRVNTMSKLTYSDSRKFVALLNDVFPGVKVEDILYEQLTKAIHDVLEELRLEKVESQTHKTLQFYEATKQRMGIVLVGPSGSGKTTIWKVLKKAHEKLGGTVKIHIMNPKSMPRTQLLGHMDNDTREFTEGVLTYSARQVVKEGAEVLNWIICDGDIDPEWIESLNSVLDDNHLLTLPTGERINFGNNVNFIFETNDLQYASPATVSRMGMIFLNNEDINIKALITKWIKRQRPEIQGKLEEFIEEYFYGAFEVVLQFEDQLAVTTTRVGTIMNALSMMPEVTSKGEFIEALIKGFAANFAPSARAVVCEELNKVIGVRTPADPKSPLDFYFAKDNNQFRAYAPDSTKQLKPTDFSDSNEPPLIKTVGAQRDLDLIKPWVQNGDPFILVGPEGCGKNMLIRNAFEELKKTMKIQIAVISCNAQTSAYQIIQKLNQVCLKAIFAQGRIYRPKEASRLVLYLKDINLPKPDKYQTIQMIAFLQQIITHRGFYDENLEFVYLDEKIQIVASMNPASTLGRFQLSTRFTANVRIAYVDYPTNEELSMIYSEYAKGVLQNPQIKLERNDATMILGLSKKIAPFLVEVYSNVKQKFLIDEHRHYLYTPSSLTSILYGLMRYEIGSTEQLIEIIAYEICRVFRDRIVNFESLSKFDNLFLGLLRQHFKLNFNPREIFYSSIPHMKEIKEGSKEIPYLTRLSAEDLKNIIQGGLVTYEREFTELKIHMLEEVLALVSQLDRILSRPGGSVLLAGRSGIAKRTCALLVGHMLRLQLFQPQITREYTVREFKKDLKLALENAAVLGKPTLLFIEDHHLTQREFLEMLNSLLSSGEVPGLYRQEEIEGLLGNNAEEIRRENFGKSLYECFVSRVQTNLRIVVNFECTHPNFASNTASNPALFSRCSIIWLENWSKESYQAIARAELDETLEKVQGKEDIQNQLIAIHRSVGAKASPRHYFSLIETFKSIFGNKIKNRGNQTTHLQAGLQKLVEAQTTVDELTSQAHQKKIELATKQAEADQALKEITKAMEKTAERKQEAEVLQGSLEQEEVVLKKAKDKIDLELADVQPLIDEAKKSVGSIRKGDLDELKSLRMPPEAIIDVLTVMLIIVGQEDVSVSSMKKFLSQRSVIESILDFDPRSINSSTRDEVNRMIAKKANSFEKSVIYRASLAAGPIADWVKAIVKYSEVLEKIKPLEDEQNKLKKKLDTSKSRLEQCKSQLIELDKKVAELKENFQKRTAEAETLRLELKKAEDTLGVAQNLLSKLGDEKNRWEGQVQTLQQQLKFLPFDSLLAAAFTIYLSDADEVVRENTLKEWKVLTKNSAFDYMKFVSTESQILKWKSEGLPGDSLSLENSLMIFNTSKTPLIIDPNTAATEWLKRHYSHEKNLEIINQNDPKFGTLLDLSVRFGKIMIIQEIDQVDSVLFPLLRKDVMVQGPRKSIQIGEKTLDYNENFKLYLCTRNPLIEIPPNANALVSVINYTVTLSGLEGQLLSIIINHEKPELEKKKTELLHNEENLKMQLADLEKALLEELASSQGNILENKTLIESLNQTKSKSNIIATSLKESSALQESLDKEREVYRGLAHKGSKLFIVMSDLQKISNMYRFSLAMYLHLFRKCLENQTQTHNVQEKLDESTGKLFRIVFNHVGSSLFKRDRLMFGLHIVKGMRPELFQANEWDFFLGNAVGNIESKVVFPSWASEDRREAFSNYASIFNRLVKDLQLESDGSWVQWYQNVECEKNFPPNLRNKISPFQKVLITQIFRPDRVESALVNFVCEALGIQSISSASLSLKVIYREEASPETPILFVTSAGSDPSKELEEFAEAEVGRDNFQQLSMGGGQNDLAIQMLKEAASKGFWLCFKNLHLVTSWLPNLEKELKMLSPHKNFRLWLTTEPHSKFPPILLETCHKVTYESPPGIKKNLQRTYDGWSPVTFEQGTTLKSQMYFVLAWFHAVVQERRTYIPQGWSKFYEFSYGDLKAGSTIIDSLLKEFDEKNFKWETLYGLLENAIYGGRIDDDLDIGVLRAYLEQYFSPEVVQGNKKVGGAIQVPQNKNVKDYLMIISKIPDMDSPNVFGLPFNIDRSVQRFNTTLVIEGMKKLLAGSTENLKFDREKWNEMLSPTIKLWKSLLKQVTEKGLPQIREKHLNSDHPVESFIFAEAYGCFQMLEKIDTAIESINKVLNGSGLLTSEIYNQALTLISGNIPSKWATYWEGPENHNSWLKGFCKRAYALKSWVHNVQNGDILKSQLNLADLFHPQIFLNAVRQLTARQTNTAIDALKLVTVLDANKARAPTIQVKGLLLQGCGFENGKLVDASAGGPEFVSLPTLYLSWIPEKENDPYPENATANLPVYPSGAREKILTKLKLPNNGKAHERVIGGVAICLTDEE